MRPNARTIKKVLMKGRAVVFWGSRAYLTVRLPASVAPPRPNRAPRPPKDQVGWEESFRGHWTREIPVSDIPLEEREEMGLVRTDGSPVEDTDILWESWVISKLYCSTDPRDDYEEGEEHGIEDRHVLLEGEPELVELKDGTTQKFQSCTYWEGLLRHNVRKAGEEFDREHIDEYTLPPEEIDAYIALETWEDKYMVGCQLEEGGEPVSEVLEEFLQAGWYAKTHYYSVSKDERYIYLTYSVMWFYPDRKFGFSSALARAFRVAHDQGIDAKLVR